MSKLKNAIKVTEILYAFKHNYNLLPDWVKEAYESMVINTVTDDSFFLEKIAGIVTIASQDDVLVQKDDGELLIMMEETFNELYKEV